MINNRCIVCMPLTVWDSTFTNTMVQLMILLSKENKVLFVDYQHTFKDILVAMAGKKKSVPVKRVLGMEERLRKVTTSIGSEIFVLTCPPVTPVNWIVNRSLFKKALAVNALIIKKSVTKALKILDMSNVIVLNGYNPFVGLPLKGGLDEALNVYYCYDEIKGDKWFARHGAAIEEEYLKAADLVITTSDGLYHSKSPINNSCHVVKNGVDFNLFNSARSTGIQKKEKIVIGYTGSIDQRFDIETMNYVIANLPEIEFEFVGRIVNQAAGNMLKKFPNVKLVGAKQPGEIPKFINEIRVGIIPYINNELTNGVYPLKINEYLAVGKPVVMTDFASLPEFESLVKVAKSKEDFLKFLLEEINTDNETKQKNRIDFAKLNSWDNRVEELSAILETYLSKSV